MGVHSCQWTGKVFLVHDTLITSTLPFQATWPASFPDFCGGSAQSPIDIVTATAMVMDPGQVQMIGYDLPMSGTITNSGHGITFTFDGGVVPYAFGGRLPEGER